MKSTVLTLALALIAPLSLSAAPLKGSFLLTADLTVAVTQTKSFSQGRASLVGNSIDTFRVSADEITIDQTDSTRTQVTLVTCRGVTAVSAGYEIPASKVLTLELDSRANIYCLNPAGIVARSTGAPVENEKNFSSSLPKLDLRLRSRTASP